MGHARPCRRWSSPTGGPASTSACSQEGEIGAGDAVRRPGAKDPERMSVADDRTPSSSRVTTPVAALERALAHPRAQPRLASGRCEELLEGRRGTGASGNAGLVAAPREPAPAWPGFQAAPRAQTKSGRERRRDHRSSWPTPTTAARSPAAKPGQHLVLRAPRRSGRTAPLLRSYSLCGDGSAPGTYRIAVKREADGAASRALHGDVAGRRRRCSASAPRGELRAGTTRQAPVVLISAGVGLTPVLAMLHAPRRSGPRTSGHGRRVWWVHAARDGAHHPFADEVRALARDQRRHGVPT